LGYIPKCWDGKDLDDFKEKRPKKRPSDVEIPSVLLLMVVMVVVVVVVAPKGRERNQINHNKYHGIK
jgi:hypothetical protein